MEEKPYADGLESHLKILFMNLSQRLRHVLGGAFFSKIFARNLAWIGAATLASGCSPGENADTANSNQPPTELTSDHVDISYRYEPGKRYFYEYKISSRTKLGEGLMPGMPSGNQEMRQNQTQKIILSVLKENPEGGKSLEIEFGHILMEMEMMGMNISIDSEKPAEDGNPLSAMLASTLEKMVGHKIHVELDENDQIVSTSGSEEMLEKMTESNPQAAAMLRGMLDMFGSEDYVENFIEPLKLPPHPVKPGDSWPVNDTQNLGPMGVLSMDLQCQLESKTMREGRETLPIAFSGTLAGKADSEASGAVPMMGEIVGGKMSGRHWFATELGMIVDSNTQMDMMMKMTLPSFPPGGSEENQEMEMETHQEIRYKLLKVETAEETGTESNSSP